ncbi:hypothetical protein MMC22_004624 [Lobaria immixta]|nr:hypothetical protein [Lobaria immixta]
MAEPKDQRVANVTVSENEPDVDKATSGNQTVANAIPSRSAPGLLDLPPEVRLMIFRHLLFHPHGYPLPSKPIPSYPLPVRYFIRGSRPPVSTMRTCKLIYVETFSVFYRENQFHDYSLSIGWSLVQFPRVIDTIQNVSIGIDMSEKPFETEKFLKILNSFGNPCVVRGTLAVDILIQGPGVNPLKWFVRALGRFTNFRTVELNFFHNVLSDILHVCEYVEIALKPVLGYAQSFVRGRKGLRFHPMDHQNLCREPEDGDWADSLDGIRLEWNEDLTNADESESLAQN